MDFLLGHAKRSTIEKAADKAGLNFVAKDGKIDKASNQGSNSTEFSKEFQRVQTNGVGIAEVGPKSGNLLPKVTMSADSDQHGLVFSANPKTIAPKLDERQLELASQSSEIPTLDTDTLSQSTTGIGLVAEQVLLDEPGQQKLNPNELGLKELGLKESGLKELGINQNAPVTPGTGGFLSESKQVLSEINPSYVNPNGINKTVPLAEGLTITDPASVLSGQGAAKVGTNKEQILPLNQLSANALKNDKVALDANEVGIRKNARAPVQSDALFNKNGEEAKKQSANKLETNVQTANANTSSNLSLGDTLSLSKKNSENRPELNTLGVKEAQLLAKGLQIKPEATFEKRDIDGLKKPSEFNVMGVKLAKPDGIPHNLKHAESISSNIESSLLNKALTENATVTQTSTDVPTVRYANASGIEAAGLTVASDSAKGVEGKSSVIPATFEQALSLRGDFSPKLALRVQWLIKQAVSSAEIMMDPPELGPLSVKMKSIGNETHIMFSVSNPQTKEAVEANINRLREMLLEQGITLGDTEVQQQDKEEKDSKTTSQTETTTTDAPVEEQHAEEVKVGLLDTYI